MSPDITMCDNKKCPLRGLCYRQTATPSKRQSYSSFEPEYSEMGLGYPVVDCKKLIFKGKKK
jgi:hypothetical protein